jgi:tetratricopeptide (TPR) repeat protein
MAGQSRTRLASCALTAVALSLAPTLALAQQVTQVTVESPAVLRLRVTTASEEASRHFWAGFGDARNAFFSRATTHFDRAIALDGNLGLARVVRAAVAPGLTDDERKAEVERGLATMTSASTGELVTALAFREFVVGNRRQAQTLFKSASNLLPGDPNLASLAAQLTMAAEGPTQAVAAVRAVTERFPDDAPSYNTLAYLLWRTGDHEGAFTAVKRYVQLAPDHPNSHDSYAELLQWDGRFSEALAHYGRSAELDSSYIHAYMGMAAALQLTARGPEARRQIQQAIARAPTKPVGIDYTRALAHSFLLDGMLKEGMEQLAVAARDAQANNRKSLAAQAHREMAVADALLGQGSAIASHLSAAAEIGGASVPEQLLAIAVAHGTAGDVATARQAAQRLATVAQSDSQYVTAARTANAIILLRENKPKDAMSELSGAKADDPLVRALLAECDRATGNTTDARTVRNQVINDPQLDLTDAHATMARVRAARIKG